MPDYILEDHLIRRLELSPVDLERFERRGIIQGVEKNGHVFYSSCEFYRLKGVLHFMRNEGLSLDEARARLDLTAVR
jgi:DNA-binding transcriptional MerR regulator